MHTWSAEPYQLEERGAFIGWLAHKDDGCSMILNDSDSSDCHGHLIALPVTISLKQR